jgi:hypothetical protein
MKYAITGHTAGIGSTVFNRLSPNIVGFSRTNGYDISKSADRARIIAEVADCDVFINNADDGGKSQFLMFIELFTAWKNENKKIINVGSQISENYLPMGHKLQGYRQNKLALKTASLNSVGTCLVEYKPFGYVDTPAMLAKYPEANFITVEQAADIILA